jgi:hypothetical protein
VHKPLALNGRLDCPFHISWQLTRAHGDAIHGIKDACYTTACLKTETS